MQESHACNFVCPRTQNHLPPPMGILCQIPVHVLLSLVNLPQQHSCRFRNCVYLQKERKKRERERHNEKSICTAKPLHSCCPFSLTFHPRFSKNVLKRARVVVLPAQGPEKRQTNNKSFFFFSRATKSRTRLWFLAQLPGTRAEVIWSDQRQRRRAWPSNTVHAILKYYAAKTAELVNTFLRSPPLVVAIDSSNA